MLVAGGCRSGTSYEYLNIELAPDYPDFNHSYATGAQDREKSYGIYKVLWVGYVNYTNAYAYRIIVIRNTGRYVAVWTITVILPKGESYLLYKVNITSIDNESIILDEYQTHIHDGIVLLSRINARLGLGGYPDVSTTNDRVYINGYGDSNFAFI